MAFLFKRVSKRRGRALYSALLSVWLILCAIGVVSPQLHAWMHGMALHELVDESSHSDEENHTETDAHSCGITLLAAGGIQVHDALQVVDPAVVCEIISETGRDRLTVAERIRPSSRAPPGVVSLAKS